MLFVYARTITRDATLAEDVVQSAFVRMCRTPVGVIDRVRNVKAMLATWTRREALTLLRVRRRREGREERWRNLRLRQRWATRDWGDDLVGEMRDAVDRLPRRQREVIVLKHVGQMTFDQMALALRINRNTVASRYRCAMRRLREAILGDSEIAGRIHVG